MPDEQPLSRGDKCPGQQENGDYRVLLDGVEAAEIEGTALRLFVRRGPFGLLRHTRSYHPPNDSWHHVELYRDHTAVVVMRARSWD